MAGICYGLRVRNSLFVLVVCLLPIHSLNYDESSSLIKGKCGNLKYVNVNFGESGYELSNSNCGVEVKLDKVNSKEAPSVTFQDATNRVKYLIAMIDPDAPQVVNPFCQSWLHWIVGNIDGEDLANGDISSGKTFTVYKPPTPPPPKAPATTNVHRYFIYVFEQRRNLDEGDEDSHCGFDIDDYKEKYDLTAVAMNMFKTHS